MKDPVWSEIVHIEVHTQLHSATRVYRSSLLFYKLKYYEPLQTGPLNDWYVLIRQCLKLD